MSTRKNVKQRAKPSKAKVKAKVRKQKQEKADDYDSRGYSTRLRDELCIECMRYDMDRHPEDYIR